MAQEIERKFLVKGDYLRDEVKAVRIVQAYLNSNPERTVRVRLKGDKAFMTVKGIGNAEGVSRFEWEKEISPEDALQLIGIAEEGAIDKTRYIIPNTDGKHVWEVDEFHADNEGLTVAEIELSDASESFDKPEWLGEEVTGDPRYYNSMLSSHPYKTWK